jgi:hypothetical protein
MAAAAVVGLAYAARALRRSREDPPTAVDGDRRSAFAAYLRDHLAGSEAALHVVAQLRDGHRGALEGPLFARLHAELTGERRVVMQVLGRLGASTMSLKQLVGDAGGSAARAASQPSGDATLLRTLEALTIGIQGKRCLWRALQMFEEALGFGEPSFLALESQAVRQWDDVDAYRRSVALTAFAI